MKADLARNFARESDGLSQIHRLVQQQGRVTLESDWNEQVDVFLHLLRTLARDLIGPYGGTPGAFEIKPKVSGGKLVDLAIGGPGHYYVDGILCEIDDAAQTYLSQPSLDFDAVTDKAFPEKPFQVYLDVWERFVCAAEHDGIREVALGGPDTCGRAQVVWQVRVRPFPAGQTGPSGSPSKAQPCELGDLPKLGGGSLKARSDPGNVSTDPCICAPDARFRGAENQLYRVEIHHGGSGAPDAAAADTAEDAGSPGQATFKWSRDNGSVVFPIVSFIGPVAILEHLGRDPRTDLVEGDLVEVQYEGVELGPRGDAHYDARLDPPPLLTVKSIDRQTLAVTLAGDLGAVGDRLRKGATLLRRWDRPAGAPAAGDEGQAADGSTVIVEEAWLDLEDGVQIWFDKATATYRSGDYWMIPARIATGDVIWPKDAAGNPASRAPDGVEHHYAPLGAFDGTKALGGCTCTLTPGADCSKGASQSRPATGEAPGPARRPRRQAAEG